MAIGWIDRICNNSGSSWYLKSVDDRHNGALKGGGASFTLDDANFHVLNHHTQYTADWCGIPWYYQGKHFKVLSKDQKRGVLFYISEIGADNWIIYEELNTGRQLARQAAPKGSDFHCNLRFEDTGVFIDIVNNNAFSGENALYQIYSEIKEWEDVLAPVVAEAIAGKLSEGGRAT
jgi:hypothetical protein